MMPALLRGALALAANDTRVHEHPAKRHIFEGKKKPRWGIFSFKGLTLFSIIWIRYTVQYANKN
jgi:hypothetical protein